LSQEAEARWLLPLAGEKERLLKDSLAAFGMSVSLLGFEGDFIEAPLFILEPNILKLIMHVRMLRNLQERPRKRKIIREKQRKRNAEGKKKNAEKDNS
jgi:hypothetical protein